MSLRESLSRKLPSEYWWVRQVLSRKWRQEICAVRNGLEPTVASPQIQLGVAGSRVAGVTIVKNEGDIIESVVRHLLSQGLDLIIAADHNSDDDTLPRLVELAQKYPVLPYRLNVVGFYQEQTITMLSKIARKMGARWIVPFDGDEYWFAESGRLADYLSNQRVPKVYADGLHVYPNPNPTASINESGRIDLGTTGYRKVAFRTSRMAYVRHGNHEVVRRGNSIDGLRIAHVPVRTSEQLRRKVREGAASMRIAGVTDRAAHWHHLDSLSNAELDGYWKVLCEGTGWEELGWKPQGPFAHVQLDGASDWQALCSTS